MRVLVTASRDWSWPEIIANELTAVFLEWRKTAAEDDEFVVVHGNARGGDIMAHQWAEVNGRLDPRVRPEKHPADWEKHGLSAGHKRNQEMIGTRIDRCLAFPWGKSPGTRGCMRMAKKAGIPVKQFPPKLW